MNHSKFSFADLLTVLGTLVFAFFCFLSFNFLTLGGIGKSIARATVLALVLGGLAFGAKLLKRTSKPLKTRIIWEWVLLFLFAVVAFVAIFPFSHYFAVLRDKTDIQRKVSSTLVQVEGMFGRYENYANNRLNTYKWCLNSVVDAKNVNQNRYRSYGFEDGKDITTQIENKMFILNAQLYPSNYKEMKMAYNNWLIKVKNTAESSWAFTFGIVKVVNSLEGNITSRKKELNKFSKFRAQGETVIDFDYTITFDISTTTFTESGTPTALSIAIAIGLYGLILLSYFRQNRHSKFPGLKVVFNIEEKESTIITR